MTKRHGHQQVPPPAASLTTAPAQPMEPAPPKNKSKAILPLIGTTQSGKTTFIKFLHDYCGQEYDHTRDLVVGDGVNSCTKVCKRYPLAVPDRTVTLVPKAGSRPASSLVTATAAGAHVSGMVQQQQQQQQQHYQHFQHQQATGTNMTGGFASRGMGAGGTATAHGGMVTSADAGLHGQLATRDMSTFAAEQQQQTATTNAKNNGAHMASGIDVATAQYIVPQQQVSMTASAATSLSAAQAAALAAREAAAKSVAMAAEAAKMCQTIGSVISESEVSDGEDDDGDDMVEAKFRAEQVAVLRQQHQDMSSASAPLLVQHDSMSSIASTTATTSTAFTCESSSGSSGSDSHGMVAVGQSMVASVSGTGTGGAGLASAVMTPEITSLHTSASHSPVLLHGQACGGILSQQAQQQQQQLLSQQYHHMSTSHTSSDGGLPGFARPSPPLPATETPSSIVVEPMISATMQTQQSATAASLSSSSMVKSQKHHQQQAFSDSNANNESQQHDTETLRIVENAIRIATGLPATGGAQLTTPPPHIAQYIDSMTARHQCQDHYQEECAKQQHQQQQSGGIQAQGSAGGFSFSFKTSTSTSSSTNSADITSNHAGNAGEARGHGLSGAESSGASMEANEQQAKDRGLFGFRKWVGKKMHGSTTTAISPDATQFEQDASAMIEPTDSMLSTTSTTTSMMTVTDTNVGNASSSEVCGGASEQAQEPCQQPPKRPEPMSSQEVITVSRRSSTSSSSSDDSEQDLGRRHRIKTKIGGMLGLSSSSAASVQFQQQQQHQQGGQQEQTCVASSADLYSQQCQDQLHDTTTQWSSTVHYAVTPSGQVVLDASGPSATMHQGSFPYPMGSASPTTAAAVGSAVIGAGAGVANAAGAAGLHESSSHGSQWTTVSSNGNCASSSGLSTTQAQNAAGSTLGVAQQTQQSIQAQQHGQFSQQSSSSQNVNTSATAAATLTSAAAGVQTSASMSTSTTQIGQSLTEMLARLEQSHRESMAECNGGSPLSPGAFLLDPHARLEYLEEIEDLLHNRHLQLYIGPPKSKTPRLEMDLIDTPGLLDAAAFTDPFVDLDHLAGILAQVKRAGHVTALVYVINIDRPYDSASLEALVTYLANLRELCSNLIVVHSSYNVHKVLESAKAAAVSSGMVAGTSDPPSFCLFDLGNRVNEFNKQLAHLGFPDVRPAHVAMDNMVPQTARAGIKALCYEGLHVFLDVVEEFAKQPVTPIERVNMVKLRLIRDVDMHVSVFLTNVIDTIRAQLYTLGQSGNETHLLIAAEKLATTRAELRRIESELTRLDTDDQVEIDQRTVKRLPVTVVREGTRRALVVLVYESKAGNIRSARLVQPRWPRAYVRHEHVDPKRYVAVLAPPPSSPWAVGPYVHVQLFTHRRDVYMEEIGKLRIAKGESAGRLTEQEAELAKWTRKLGEGKRKVAELETRLTTLKRALGVVDSDRLPLELFVEVVEQYREIAKLQYAGKNVDQGLVKALGESVERFFYRRF